MNNFNWKIQIWKYSLFLHSVQEQTNLVCSALMKRFRIYIRRSGPVWSEVRSLVRSSTMTRVCSLKSDHVTIESPVQSTKKSGRICTSEPVRIFMTKVRSFSPVLCRSKVRSPNPKTEVILNNCLYLIIIII